MAAKNFLDSIFKKFSNTKYDFESYPDCITALSVPDPLTRIMALENIIRLHINLVSRDDINKFEELMRNDDNLQVQETAMSVLGEIGTEECINSLIEMLSFPDQWLRVKAIQVLGELKNVKALRAIKDAYNGIKSEYKQSVLRTIERMEEDIKNSNDLELTKELEKELEDPFLARYASLGVPETTEQPLFNDTQAKEPFHSKQVKTPEEVLNPSSPYKYTYSSGPQTTLLSIDKESIIREMLEHHLETACSGPADQKLAGALYKAFAEKREEAEHMILNALTRDSLSIKLQAIQALITLKITNKYTNHIIPYLDDPSPQLTLMALAALMNSDNDIIADKVLALLKSRDKTIQLLAQNYFIIHSSKENTLLIKNSIMNGDPGERSSKIALLIQMSGENSREVIKQLFATPNLSEKVMIAILEKIPPSFSDIIVSSIPAIISINDENTFKLASRFLAGNNDLILKDYLIYNLSSTDPKIKGRVVFLLAMLKAKGYTKTIAGLLNDASEYVRLQAALALGELDASEYTNHIVAGINSDPSKYNKLEYIKVVFMLQKSNAIPLFMSIINKTPAEIQAAILDNMSRVDPKTIANKEQIIIQLIEMLGTTDIRVYFYAVLNMVKMGHTTFAKDRNKILSTLWSLVKDSRNPTKIRSDSLICLYAVGQEESLSSLRTIAQSDKDTTLATEAMQYMADSANPDAILALEQLSNHPNPERAKMVPRLLKQLKENISRKEKEREEEEKAREALF